MNEETSPVQVGKAADVPEGSAMVVRAHGRDVAIYRVGGEYFAIDNECPHHGGPLGEGELVGVVVRCPWHGWGFHVTTGISVSNPTLGVACYPVEVGADGCVYVSRAGRRTDGPGHGR